MNITAFKITAKIFIILIVMAVVFRIYDKATLTRDEIEKFDFTTEEDNFAIKSSTVIPGSEIVADADSVLTNFIERPYEVGGGLNELHVSLVTEPQQGLSYTKEGVVYASSSAIKNKELKSIRVNIQIDENYFESQDKLNEAVSFMVIKTVTAAPGRDASFDETINQVIASYKRLNGRYPFELRKQ